MHSPIESQANLMYAGVQEFNLPTLLHSRLGHVEPQQLHGGRKGTQSGRTSARWSLPNSESHRPDDSHQATEQHAQTRYIDNALLSPRIKCFFFSFKWLSLHLIALKLTLPLSLISFYCSSWFSKSVKLRRPGVKVSGILSSFDGRVVVTVVWWSPPEADRLGVTGCTV